MAEDNSTAHFGTLKRDAINIVLAIFVGFILFLALKYGGLVKSFLYSPRGEVNILVLGKGGIGHEAPDLTDTIIFVSISQKDVNLISLPRDLWIPEIRAKLNSAYYWGKLPLAKSTVEKIVGVPVEYGLVIDFSGFKKIVDALGGIEVEVKNSFVDEKYPIPGKEKDLCDGDTEYKCRYEVVRFEKGKQVMDGDTALKFVRSRNAQGEEGTDLAREARQQLVLGAIKDKVLSLKVLLNPRKVFALKNAVMEAIETDVDANTAASIGGLFFSARRSISSHLIPDELLVHPPISRTFDRQYVFIPKAGNGDWEEIGSWMKIVTQN